MMIFTGPEVCTLYTIRLHILLVYWTFQCQRNTNRSIVAHNWYHTATKSNMLSFCVFSVKFGGQKSVAPAAKVAVYKPFTAQLVCQHNSLPSLHRTLNSCCFPLLPKSKPTFNKLHMLSCHVWCFYLFSTLNAIKNSTRATRGSQNALDFVLENWFKFQLNLKANNLHHVQHFFLAETWQKKTQLKVQGCFWKKH